MSLKKYRFVYQKDLDAISKKGIMQIACKGLSIIECNSNGTPLFFLQANQEDGAPLSLLKTFDFLEAESKFYEYLKIRN